MARWLLFLDLDGTLWDHPDVSMLNPPFQKVREGVIRDSKGEEIRLYNDMIKLLKWAKKHGAFISTLSWNNPSHALSALKAFGIKELFDYHAIEPHPAKEEYAWKIIKTIEKQYNIKLKPCQIVYIDDRAIHLDGITKKLGEIIYIQALEDFITFDRVRDKIVSKLCTSPHL